MPAFAVAGSALRVDRALHQNAMHWTHAGLITCGTTVCFHSQEGLLALYKGWTPSVLGVIPYVGLNFAGEQADT
jgi:hypothetical protein